MSKKTENATLISVKELAAQLNVADALLKKYVRDFEIPTEKVKNRTHVEESNVDMVKEIVKLRAAGKTSKDIKAILQLVRSQETAEKEELKAEKLAKKAVKVKDDKKPAIKKTKTVKAKKAVKPKEEEAKEEKPEAKLAKKEVQEEVQEEKSEKTEDKKAVPYNKDDKRREGRQSRKDRFKAKKDKKKENDGEFSVDVTEYLRDEAAEKEDLEGSSLIKSIEDEIGELPEDLDDGADEPEEIEVKDSKSRRGVRRKAFNFRYAQRQIADDSRRVNYIKHKLRRTNISVQERMDLEAALDSRSKLLNGWLHILRWVKSRSYR